MPVEKRVRFIKIENNHDRLRDDVIEGTYSRKPVIGECFEMYGKPRDIDIGFRAVNTSPIKKIQKFKTDVMIVTTESGSKYRLEFY